MASLLPTHLCRLTSSNCRSGRDQAAAGPASIGPRPAFFAKTLASEATMADSDSSDVEFLEARKAAASAAEPNAERSDGGVVGTKPSKKRRKAPGPPPRLAWGAGSAIGGGGAGGAGALAQ